MLVYTWVGEVELISDNKMLWEPLMEGIKQLHAMQIFNIKNILQVMCKNSGKGKKSHRDSFNKKEQREQFLLSLWKELSRRE